MVDPGRALRRLNGKTGMDIPAGHRADWIRMALDEYERCLIRYAARLTGDLEVARDVVQETFLRLCREKRSRIGNHLGPWLFTVCRNLALDVKRREKRMEQLSQCPPPQADSGAHPLLALEKREAVSQILQILETLPASQQEVIRLRFQNGLSYKEISSITRLSVTNASSPRCGPASSQQSGFSDRRVGIHAAAQQAAPAQESHAAAGGAAQ